MGLWHAGEKRNLHKMLLVELEVKRSLGRARHR
jgi:hypothetical protein